MVDPKTKRQSGLTAGQETVMEASGDADSPLDTAIDQTKKFRTPGFARMRTDWDAESAFVRVKAQKAADDRLEQEFRDAFVILAHIYDLVRQPKVNDNGEPIKDEHGWVIWAKDEYGSFIEDWTKLRHDERDTLLFAISTRLFDWEQRSANAWADAMFAKGQWEERFAIGFDAPMSGTVQDREAAGRKDAAEERYFAIYMTAYSRKTEALVRTFSKLVDRLRDSIVSGR